MSLGYKCCCYFLFDFVLWFICLFVLVVALFVFVVVVCERLGFIVGFYLFTYFALFLVYIVFVVLICE